jgi:hypothetical protein
VTVVLVAATEFVVVDRVVGEADFVAPVHATATTLTARTPAKNLTRDTTLWMRTRFPFRPTSRNKAQPTIELPARDSRRPGGANRSPCPGPRRARTAARRSRGAVQFGRHDVGMPLPLNAMTPRSRHVLIRAGELAEQAGHLHIGTEHLLLALARRSPPIPHSTLCS